jgi:hypothetical protein
VAGTANASTAGRKPGPISGLPRRAGPHSPCEQALCGRSPARRRSGTEPFGQRDRHARGAWDRPVGAAPQPMKGQQASDYARRSSCAISLEQHIQRGWSGGGVQGIQPCIMAVSLTLAGRTGRRTQNRIIAEAAAVPPPTSKATMTALATAASVAVKRPIRIGPPGPGSRFRATSLGVSKIFDASRSRLIRGLLNHSTNWLQNKTLKRINGCS